MGFGTHRFITAIDPNLICGICGSVLEDPVLTPCGHSFCKLCLNTWLSKPDVRTCPECRSKVTSTDVKPVLSLRNLINGFDVTCDNNGRGCKVITKLEKLACHLETCGYVPVSCAGCGTSIHRYELASHQMRCEGIAAALKDDEDNERSRAANRLGNIRLSASITSAEVSNLVSRISFLEQQLKTFKRDLQISESKNRVLEREYRKSREELQDKRNELLDAQYADFDPDYDYGYTPESIAKLSLLIARFLLKKPCYVDSDRIFSAIKRCYENYARCGTEFEHDVHMLVASAFASNWFGEAQRINFHCWLQSIARYRQATQNCKSLSSSMFENRKYTQSETLGRETT